MPMSARRITAEGASLVCSVDSTRWPVSDASTAICAVSRSRISPTMMMSGSWRRNERRAVAKVRPAFLLICTCETPASWYSTGSSTVMMFFSTELILCRTEYSVVVLPDPVGPVVRNMPLGWATISSSLACTSGVKPSLFRPKSTLVLSRMRMTIFSPNMVGRQDTRMS